MSEMDHPSALGPTRLGFADERDVDAFVDMLGKFERGEIAPDAWRAFRLVNGVYGQRQEGDSMMIRCKIPQGILTTGQLHALADVAERWSNGKGHVTTRQNVQFHFVHLADTEVALRRLADSGLTTREACGNSVRNITGCPYAGVAGTEPFDVTPYAEAATRHLLRGPLSSTLPRKFKIGFGGCCGTDCIGAAFSDIGFLARLDELGRPAFRVTLGGGLATLRRSGIRAHELAPAGDVLEICEAVLRVFDRTGDRKRKDKARLKFVVERLGPEGFLAEYRKERNAIAAEGGRPLPPLSEPPPVPRKTTLPLDVRSPGFDVFLRENVRAQKQRDRAVVTVRVPLGDLTAAQFRALAAIASRFSEEEQVRTTPEQNLVIRFVALHHLPALHAALAEAQLAVPGPRTVADVTSCPGAMSCRLAVTASRGVATLVSRALEQRPDVAGRARSLSIKVSGCPNGCGQHYVAGIGLQGSVRKLAGRAVPQYHLYVGGGVADDGASFGRLAAKIPARRVAQAVERLIDLYDRDRLPGEAPEAFLARFPLADVHALLADLERLDETDATPEDFIDPGEDKAFEVQIQEGECAA